MWDAYFDEQGKERDRKDSKVEVATSNKMRGPLSDQPKKIGEPILGVVDHVYFSHRDTISSDNGDQHFEFKGHVFEPLAYEQGKVHGVYSPRPREHMQILGCCNCCSRPTLTLLF